jgi:uncharacterized membrane protein HdeD (DUF308 family)
MSSVLVAAAAPDRAVNQLWWIGMIEAALALFFGISAIFWPGLTLVTLVYLFSAFVLGLGVLHLISGLASIRRRSTWWITSLLGMLWIGLGVYLVRHPDVSFKTFILLIGLFLIARGILDLVRAFIDRAATSTKVLSAVIGLAAVVAGILILVQPAAGGIAFVWILGLYAILLGSLGMTIALELRAALMEQLAEAEGAPSEARHGGNDRRRKAGVRTA